MCKACTDLEAAGYILTMTQSAGVDVVSAKRTPAATIDIKSAGPLLLALSRAQDAAVAYMRGAGRVYVWSTLATIEQRIKSGQLSEADEARAIYEYNAALFGGDAKSSDGYTWASLAKAVK